MKTLDIYEVFIQLEMIGESVLHEFFLSRWPGFTEHPWRNESATVYAAYRWETFKDNIFSHQLDFEFAIWLFLHDFITYH